MRIRSDEDNSENVINMSSLLDVMFILIIFFLATATFDQLEHDVQVNLPTASAAQSASSAPRLFVINVRQGGKYNVASQSMGLDTLRQKLKAAVQKNPDQKVLIRGDKKAYHGQVAAAVNACKQVGVRKANIGYQSRAK